MRKVSTEKSWFLKISTETKQKFVLTVEKISTVFKSWYCHVEKTWSWSWLVSTVDKLEYGTRCHVEKTQSQLVLTVETPKLIRNIQREWVIKLASVLSNWYLVSLKNKTKTIFFCFMVFLSAAKNRQLLGSTMCEVNPGLYWTGGT